MSRRLPCLIGLALLSACAVQPQSMANVEPNVPVPPAAWAHAEQQADRFDRAFHTGGMSGVAADINECYATARHSGEPIAVRDCLVYDGFADRFAAQVDRQFHLGIPPYFQPATAYPRLAHYSGPAGFNDAQIMAGYLNQGANTIFAVMASRSKASQ